MSKDLGLCANRPADRCRVTISRGQENLLTISGTVQYMLKMRTMIERIAGTMSSVSAAANVSAAVIKVCGDSTITYCTDRTAVSLGSGLTLVVTPIWSANT